MHVRLDRLLTLALANPIRFGLDQIRTFTSARSDVDVSRRNELLPILMYHSISDDSELGFGDYYKTCTSPRRFAEHMQWLADAGWRGVSLTQGLNALRPESALLPNSATCEAKRIVWDAQNTRRSALFGGPNLTARRPKPPTHRDIDKLVAITFDDGFKDFQTAAFPVLRQHGFSATMYVPTAFVGDPRKTFKTRECLTWCEVRNLHQAGIEFGSHTVNHPKLVDLSWTAIEAELRDSKNTIEQEIGSSICAFAYPYAYPQADRNFTARFRGLLAELGYQTAVTTAIGRADFEDNVLQLPRLPANSADDQPLLKAKLCGAYDWVGAPQLLHKRMNRWLNRSR